MLPIESEIRRFLRTADAEVLCIRGRWGVGKTYAWKKFLKAAVAEDEIALDTYSYVSLFGRTSIRDARRGIFESQVSLKLQESPSATTVSKSLSQGLGFTRKSVPAMLKMMPFLRNAGEELANAAFGLINRQIVCLDDMERVGEGLRVKDILGLVSFLREEKECKIALLLNDEKMGQEDKRDFDEQIEKVADVTIEFAPSPAESCSIAIPDSFPMKQELEDAVVKVGIANIRTIKRIERMATDALEILSGLHENVRKQAVLTTTIGVWAKLHPSEAPPLEYLRGYNAFELGWRDHEGKLEEHEKVWADAIQATGYVHSDDFDLAVLDAVAAGYFDQERLRSAGEKIDSDHARSSRGSAFSQAWRLYHDSFKDNEGAVLDAMFDAIGNEPDAINPSNLNAAVRLFREMGRDEQASEIVKLYIDAHADDRSFFNLSNYPFAGDVNDPELRAAFTAKYESFVDDRDPLNVLLECARRSGWNSEDAELLGKLTVDDFVAMFEELDGEDTSTVVKRALTFGEPSSATGRLISENAADALRIIANKSSMNRRRVQGLGVELEPSSDTLLGQREA